MPTNRFVVLGLALPLRMSEAAEQRAHFRDAFLDRFADRLGRVQFRFLRQVADVNTGLWSRLTIELLVDAGHDALLEFVL